MKFLQFKKFCWTPMLLLELHCLIKKKKVEEFACWKFWLCWWQFWFFASFLARFKIQNLTDSCVKCFILSLYALSVCFLEIEWVDLCNSVWSLSQWWFSDEGRLQLSVLWESAAHCIYWHTEYVNHLGQYSASMKRKPALCQAPF